MTEARNRTAAPAAGLNGDWLTKDRLHNLLNVRKPAEGEVASSVYLKPGDTAESSEWRERLARLGKTPEDSGSGLVGFRAGGRALVIAPPFPITESSRFDTWDEGPLWTLLDAERTFGVVLVRLGRYSVAVYRGGDLVTSKTDSRYVKGKHHAGGTSQLRFQRIREGQMRKMYDKTCATVHRQFAPYAGKFDYIFLGGERFTLNGFLKVCPYMEQFRSITLGRRLNIRDPKRDTLDEVGGMLHESRVYQFQW
ncbi:MAG: Vms1/Ankzf1 family peptidyl-tRNA hydrolase [Chloroflexota bacterium]|nr:Vms1/Ankzf1 family peptidyl-tRNA hydrolase [Chloroflexota bacterium]